jgi:hypothetical protein
MKWCGWEKHNEQSDQSSGAIEMIKVIFQDLTPLRRVMQLAKPNPIATALTFLCCWLCLVPIVGGCSKVDRAEWREEVQLATGEIVIVKRAAVAEKSGFPVAPRGGYRSWEITFPDGVSWKGNGQEHPLALEMREGKDYLVVNIRSRDLCKKYNDPPSSSVFFRWDGNAWTQIQKDEFPKGGKANLLTNPWGRDSWEDLSGLVKNEKKHLVMSYNQEVNRPLESTLSDRTLDACTMLKTL